MSGHQNGMQCYPEHTTSLAMCGQRLIFKCKSHQSRMMKYIFLGNLLGLPGISLPVGYDDNTNLPIGLHLCLGEV